MADELDHMQVQEDFLIHLQIQAVRGNNRCAGISLTCCERCNNDIPLGRQRAVPGVRICMECQRRTEIQGRHTQR
ncbi:conjugal transfer protein TraR (plasmid) [Yersinia hibernica]|uniref:Conjugal transfer protein TraR n=3 Tax=Yersiniaceae TaxID=1903411 RepID=A0A7U5PH49_YEREN|nr:conjugal transfer protein TraR [Yersinia hibernica]MBX9489505.1 TraR/DksA C4-type zinc finger protein [Yersinia enterocolitica]MBX9492127.1 TraR/DksA C4-type zinc finger protein [Yersinia enterocolitica]